MRKVPLIPGAVAILGLVAVGLVGCSQSPEASCVPAVDDSKLADLVSVSGDVGELPEVDLYTPFHSAENGSTRAVAGEGTPITTDSQVLIMDFMIVSGESGEVVYESGFSGAGAPTQLAALTQLIPAASDALRCANAGSRTVIGAAPGGIIPEAAASLGLTEKDSAVVVVDVQQVYLPRAEGSLVFNTGNGLPSVVRAPDGRPGVTIPDAAAPTATASQTLIRGDGPEITSDDSVRVHYVRVNWDDREQLDSSWDTEPTSLSLASVPEDLAAALEGQTVGSQVLVVIPATAEAAASEQFAQVFVFDILGIDPATAP